MPGTGGRDYYIITMRGERGPIDRAEMRQLLANDDIQGGDQVRSAFGRPLGSVLQVLATPSDRQGHVPGRAASPAGRGRPGAPAIPIPVVIAALLIVAAAILWLSSRPAAAPLPEPAPLPAAPTIAPVSPTPAPPPAGASREPEHLEITASEAALRSAALAADGDLSTSWRGPVDVRDGAGRLAWILYQAGLRRAQAYALVAPGNLPQGDPSSWRLVGLRPDGQEQILDARHDEAFTERYQRRIFTIAKPGDYRRYRLDLFAVRGNPPADAFQIAEFTLLDNLPTAPVGLPAGWSTDSIGSEGSPPPTCDGTLWTVFGAGTDIAYKADQFRFVHTPITGDATITAFLLASSGQAEWAKPGLMLRTSTQADAPHVLITVSPRGRVEFNHRPTPGANFIPVSPYAASLPVWLRLTRRGSQVTGALSINGNNWQSAGSVSLPALAGPLLAGLVVCSKQPGKPMTTLFTHVGVTRP